MTEQASPSKVTPTKEKLIVVGNGMAGGRALSELLKIAPDAYDITVFGAEPYGNYDRIMLSPLLAGEKTLDDIMINDVPWYAENGIDLVLNCKIEQIDRDRKVVIGADGREMAYDKLLLTTGSNPFIIPVPGHDKEGVITFRDMYDIDAMLAAAKNHKHAVVIGGGLLGLEAANGLMKQGMDVTVVHIMGTLMERQLDQPAGKLLRDSLIERGMTFRMEAQTQEILGDSRAQALRFADGEEIPADLVVMAAGIRPNIDLPKAAGLECERGLLVDSYMRTQTDDNIFSIGECIQHNGNIYGLVAPIWDQAKVLARTLAGVEGDAFADKVLSTKLKVTGIDLFSAGEFQGDESTDDLVFQDPARGVYKRVVLKENKVQGAVLYGDTADGAWYFQMMRDGQCVSDIRETLLFGQAYAAGPGVTLDPAAQVASMPDDAEICGCNGVDKVAVVGAINEHGLTDVAGVRAYTKASASCGSCTNLVEGLLGATLGTDMSAPQIKPMCGCTIYSHQQVRDAIVEQKLTTMDAVRSTLEWQNDDGCHSCRPALNYYLLSSWPKEYQDDPQSRFINERAHGNIQKDGTYSVVPRMWGGLTNPKELRAIADVAEKYDIPTVKVTGGQRLDLLGVKKQDLPMVWKDLNDAGMVSGHAYAKGLRTVKTCVGQEWCRFGTQRSMEMGVELEKLTWGSWMPHKFKMAVSGCPRNCAEATIKDFGIICVDSGYELHIAGNGGIKLRGTDLLCRATTAEEVEQICLAFIQLYREEGHYLERTAPYLERVGLEHIQARVVDDLANRQALAARFTESQDIYQTDPWAERAAGDQAHEFTPLKKVS